MHLTWTYTTLDNLPPVQVLANRAGLDCNFDEELQRGQCGGQSCPPEYEEMLAQCAPPSGSHYGCRINPCGGGRRVIRSTKSFT